jgi:hypothetical protein
MSIPSQFAWLGQTYPDADPDKLARALQLGTIHGSNPAARALTEDQIAEALGNTDADPEPYTTAYSEAFDVAAQAGGYPGLEQRDQA